MREPFPSPSSRAIDLILPSRAGDLGALETSSLRRAFTSTSLAWSEVLDAAHLVEVVGSSRSVAGAPK